MRASTLFVVTVAILIGLGLAIAAKVSGIFNPPVAPAPVVVKKPEVNVLVANRPVFAGDLMDPAWVRVRPMTAEEMTHYEEHKDQYLPPLPQSVALRVAQKTLETDQPILRDCIRELAKPDCVSQRLLSNMRAVNVSLPKDHSDGGLIQVGEWVDVLLTTTVEVNGKQASTRTAPVANKLRVIAKRNALWPIFAPLPDDKLVHFTLETNPYRAALIEFSKDKGNLSFAAVSAAEQRELEERRTAWLQVKAGGRAPTFSIDDSAEYRDEDARVDAINRGELSINTGDLVRIFGIQPPPTPEPPKPLTTIQRFSGTSRGHSAVFNDEGQPVDEGGPPVKPAATFQPRFFAPPCETCKEKKEKKAVGGK
jgi:Flp pilus assembly protein CpaB